MSEVLRDQHTTGRIVAVHEQSMHVVTEQGVDFELLIPPDCPVDLAELERYRDSGANVRIDFDGSPSAHSAHLTAVRPADL
jgi:hypothetical protein